MTERPWFLAYRRWRRRAAIVPGETWFHDRTSYSNPFCDAYWEIEVIATKQGWVQYRLGSRVLELTEHSFRAIYKPKAQPA